MAESRKRFVWNARLGLAAILGAAVLAAAVYVRLAGQGNGVVAAECRESAVRAASLDPLIGGEVAAFTLAAQPQKLTELAFTGADGAPVTLAAYGGKVTLVNLWATWCVPCRQEMPALDRLQAALGGEDFSVVPISIDIGDPARPKAFLESIGVRNLPLLIDRSTKIFEDLKTKGLAIGLPVTLLLDRNGCSLGHINGPAEWDSPDGQKLIKAAIGEGADGA